MKHCAFCNNQDKLTKEHIWPKSIIDKFQYDLDTYNPNIDRLIRAEPVIKDVCAECNNVKLSLLDSYISRMYDGYLYKQLNPGDYAYLKYDYEKLLRALLKISYNSSRAYSKTDSAEQLKRLAGFMLDGGYHFGVKLRLLIVTSAHIKVGNEIHKNAFPVTELRCGELPYDGDLHKRFIIRLVAINSFWFYIILSKKRETKDKWKRVEQGFKTWGMQPGIEIKSGTSEIQIPKEQTTYMCQELVGTLWDAMANA